MDIVIHGTKGGRKIFTNKKLSGLLDVTSDSPKGTTIGQQAYALRFIENSTIFSIYRIIRDVRGDKRTGFVAFSLILPKNKNLSGVDIITLLDKVSEEYCLRYIIDNNLKDINEDWDFLERISIEYETKLRDVDSDDIDKLESDSKDDAFIYYKNGDELKSYFDDPFHNEYSDFRQILFVNEDLKDKNENPLNALRHSENNLTGKIDLENPKYKLLFNSQANGGVSITIKANGSIRSNKNKIRRKDDLEITWKKRYYDTEIQQGKCFEISSEFIKVDPIEHTVTVKEIELKEEEKNINLEIKDRKGVIVYNAEIYLKSNYQSERNIYGNRITLKGNQLGEHWIVWAKKGDRMFTDNRPIDIEKDSINPIKLIFKEKKIIKVVARDEESNEIIDNFKVWVPGKVDTKAITQIIFEDDEIEKKWRITLESDNYQRTSAFEFYPEREVEIELKLKKKPNKHRGTGGDSKFKDNSNSLDNTNEKNRKPKVIAVLTFGVIILSLGIWLLVSFFNPDKNKEPIDEMEIQDYIEGDSLILNQLNYYKVSLENQKPNLEENGGSILELFGFAKKETDFTEYNRWNKVKQSLDRAITKRNLVDSKNFVKLEKLKYSIQQQKFKLAIENLKSKNKYGEIKNQLVDISNLTLTKIADSINTILNKTSNDNLKKQEEEPEDKNLIEQIPETKQAPPPSSKKTVITTPNQKVSASEDNPMSIQLQSSSITKKQLSEYKEKFPTDKAIQLYLDFWKIITSNQKTDFDDLLKKVNKNDTLKKSELKKFLNTICKNEDEFNKFSRTGGRATYKTLGELKSKI